MPCQIQDQFLLELMLPILLFILEGHFQVVVFRLITEYYFWLILLKDTMFRIVGDHLGELMAAICGLVWAKMLEFALMELKLFWDLKRALIVFHFDIFYFHHLKA